MTIESPIRTETEIKALIAEYWEFQTKPTIEVVESELTADLLSSSAEQMVRAKDKNGRSLLFIVKTRLCDGMIESHVYENLTLRLDKSHQETTQC